jgi:hypothetical protein
MKIKLMVKKDGASLYSAMHDVSDADSFGKACADAWRKLRQRRLDQETSIGALMENIDGNVLDQLSGAQISVERA